MNNTNASKNKINFVLASSILTLSCTLTACGDFLASGAGSGGSGIIAANVPTTTNNSADLDGLVGYVQTSNAYMPPCDEGASCIQNFIIVPEYIKYTFSSGTFNTNAFALMNNQWGTINLPQQYEFTDYLVSSNWETSESTANVNEPYNSTAIVSGSYLAQSTAGSYIITDNEGMTYLTSVIKTDLSNRPLLEKSSIKLPPAMTPAPTTTITVSKNFPSGSIRYEIKSVSTLARYEINVQHQSLNLGPFTTWEAFMQQYNSSTLGVPATNSYLHVSFDEPTPETIASPTGNVYVKDNNGVAYSSGTYTKVNINGQQLLLVTFATSMGMFNQLYAVKNGVIYSGKFIPAGTEYNWDIYNQTAINALVNAEGHPVVLD